MVFCKAGTGQEYTVIYNMSNVNESVIVCERGKQTKQGKYGAAKCLTDIFSLIYHDKKMDGWKDRQKRFMVQRY